MHCEKKNCQSFTFLCKRSKKKPDTFSRLVSAQGLGHPASSLIVSLCITVICYSFLETRIWLPRESGIKHIAVVFMISCRSEKNHCGRARNSIANIIRMTYFAPLNRITAAFPRQHTMSSRVKNWNGILINRSFLFFLWHLPHILEWPYWGPGSINYFSY